MADTTASIRLDGRFTVVIRFRDSEVATSGADSMAVRPLAAGASMADRPLAAGFMEVAGSTVVEAFMVAASMAVEAVFTVEDSTVADITDH